MYVQDASSIESPVMLDYLYDMQCITSEPTATIGSRSGPQEQIPRPLANRSVASVDRLVSPLFDSLRKQISGFGTLKRNWDSYGSKPIKGESIRAALKLLSCLSEELPVTIGEDIIPTAAVPVPDGGVQLEWMLADSEIEVEFGVDGSISCLLVWKDDSEPRFEEFDNLRNDDVTGLITKQIRVFEYDE